MCLSAATRLLQSSQDFILTFSAATRPGLRASSERGNSAELDLKGHLTNSESSTMRRFVWAPGRRKHIKQYKQGGNCFSWHCPVSGKMSPKSIISLLSCILTWGCWWGWGGCRGGWAPAAPCWITRTQCLPCLIFWQKVLHLARNFCSFNTCFETVIRILYTWMSSEIQFFVSGQIDFKEVTLSVRDVSVHPQQTWWTKGVQVQMKELLVVEKNEKGKIPFHIQYKPTLTFRFHNLGHFESEISSSCGKS